MHMPVSYITSKMFEIRFLWYCASRLFIQRREKITMDDENKVHTLIHPHQYEIYEFLILSEQVPTRTVLRWFEQNPSFSKWYDERKKLRGSP